MKNLLHFLCAMFFMASLTSCTDDYVQLVYTSPADNSGIKKESGNYVYENDQVKVVYSFWDRNGIMAFAINNKTDAPLYIDWKRSSFINQGHPASYYSDKTTNQYSAVGGSSTSGWRSAFGGYSVGGAFSSGWVSGTQVITRQERITFLPPHSIILVPAMSKLTRHLYFDITNPRHTKHTKVEGVDAYVTTPGKGGSIEFRNFLTYASSEDMSSAVTLDNTFYVSKVVSMKKQDFGFVEPDGYLYNSDWKAPTRFYIPDLNENELFAEKTRK